MKKKTAERATVAVPNDVLADAIVKISTAVTALKQSGLNEDAIVVLTAKRSHVSEKNIRLVLRSLRELKSVYCS